MTETFICPDCGAENCGGDDRVPAHLRCKCSEIMSKDPSRHFKGCPKRKDLDSAKQSAIDEEAIRADEREACATECAEVCAEFSTANNPGAVRGAQVCVHRIRARGVK